MKFAFISRYEPTDRQHALAKKLGIELVHVGDKDAFSIEPGPDLSPEVFTGVVVVHPAAALRLAPNFTAIGVFENVNRAPAGEKPSFEAKELHLYSLRG